MPKTIPESKSKLKPNVWSRLEGVRKQTRDGRRVKFRDKICLFCFSKIFSLSNVNNTDTNKGRWVMFLKQLTLGKIRK